MLERVPWLMVPLINEVFHTDYDAHADLVQFKNEHVTLGGKVVTDTFLAVGSLQVGQRRYHLECQSRPDGNIAIRMMEYDFLIALEQITEMEAGYKRITFPRSCVLYLRHTKHTPEQVKVEIVLPDGESFWYRVPIIKVQDYTKDEIFRKNLLVLLPYYIMRYEKQLKMIEHDEAKLGALAAEYQRLLQDLARQLYGDPDVNAFAYIMQSMKTIAEHILKDEPVVLERIGKVMGGKVLEFETDRAWKAGHAAGERAGFASGEKNGIAIGERNGMIIGEVKAYFLTGMQIPEIAGRTGQTVEGVKKILADQGLV